MVSSDPGNPSLQLKKADVIVARISASQAWNKPYSNKKGRLYSSRPRVHKQLKLLMPCVCFTEAQVFPAQIRP